MAPQIYHPDPPNGSEHQHSGSTPDVTPSQSSPSSPLWENRFPILVGTYIALTSTLLYRVSRSPLSASRKWEQYETIFKGTTLAAVLAGVGLSGGLNRKRSEVVQERLTQKQQQQQQQQQHEQHEHTDERSQLDRMSEKEKKRAREIVREGGVQRD